LISAPDFSYLAAEMARYSLFILLFSLQVFAAKPRETVYAIYTLNSWGTQHTILLTGFGPFGSIKDNPAGRIVKPLQENLEKSCGESTKLKSLVLPVEPGTIESAGLADYSKVVSIGVDAGSSAIRIERAARNLYEDPYTGESSLIDPNRPKGEVLWGPFIPTSLEGEIEGFDVKLGDEWSAGTYVCNDTYYRLCEHDKKGFFIHIPNISPKQDTRLAKALSTVACSLFDLK
jgi:pyroglutamyl-peptidase